MGATTEVARHAHSFPFNRAVARVSGAVLGWSLAVAACAGLTVFLVFLARHAWRAGDPRGDTELMGGLRASADVLAGAKRAIPMAWLNGLWLLAASAAKLFETIGGAAARLVVPMAVAAAALMGLCFIALYLVVYYNRPRFIVAPHYRHEPGLTAIRRREGTLARARLWRLLKVAAFVVGVAVMFLVFGR